jgi:hypothetical protein
MIEGYSLYLASAACELRFVLYTACTTAVRDSIPLKWRGRGNGRITTIWTPLKKYMMKSVHKRCMFYISMN